MKEIEVKVLDINKELIEDRLAKLGAKKVFEGDVSSWHYDFPDKRIKNAKNHLRIRQEGDHSFITFKSSISQDQAKIMEELEINISDIDMMKNIFEKIGLEVKGEFQKQRVSYKLDGAKVELDKNPNIPWYLEIEAQSIKHIRSISEALEIERNQLKPWTTKQVYKHYKK
jgi:predicted adenylyl cyclase CyaB|tara:strand:+ start:359 stop:868 length:510 start_codon:yes stop_codon:yes gene_type:complete